MHITLKDHWQFHQWRVSEITAWISALNPEILTEKNEGTFGSLDLLVRHLYFAEWVWYRRLKGDSGPFQVDELIPMLEICVKWREISALWAEEVDTAHERTMTYRNLSGDFFSSHISEVMMHLVDHASYHTGQLMTTARMRGITPIHTGYIHYRRIFNEQQT